MLKELYSEDAPATALDAFSKSFDTHTAFFRTHYFNIVGRMARLHPVLHSMTYDDGFSVVSRHDIIAKIATQPEIFSNRGAARLVPSAPLPAMLPVDANGADHESLRRVLTPSFTPGRIGELALRVNAHARAVLQEGLGRGWMDIVTDLGQPVTGQITMDILGLPREAWHDYAGPIHNSAFCIGTMAQRATDFARFAERVRAEVARCAHDPNAIGLIATLGRAASNGHQMPDADIEAVVNNIIIGGLDTTQAALSCAVVFLGRNPDRRRELINHPERIPNAVNEMIRVFAPAPMTGRTTERDTEVDGHLFRAHETTLLFWAAANFDAAYVPLPLEVNFTRAQTRMVSFAMGPHRCLGIHLAKMELNAFLGAILDLAPDYRIIEEGVTIPEDISGTLAYANVPVLLRPAL